MKLLAVFALAVVSLATTGCALAASGRDDVGTDPASTTPDTTSPPTTTEPTEAVEATPMRMFNGRVVRSSANFNGGKPTYFALVQWENGVDCSRATVNGGTFDRIAVGKRGKATKLTMHIRGGSENGYGGTPIRVDGKTVDLYCAIQTEHYARLIPLDANPGARLVDGACNCALPVMPRAEATKLLSELRVA